MKIKLWLLFYILNVPVSERGNEVSGKYQLLARKLKEEKNSRNTQTLKSALSGM